MQKSKYSDLNEPSGSFYQPGAYLEVHHRIDLGYKVIDLLREEKLASSDTAISAIGAAELDNPTAEITIYLLV